MTKEEIEEKAKLIKYLEKKYMLFINSKQVQNQHK